MASPGSPYPLGTPVTDPQLLQNRRNEIEAALDTVAPAEGGDPRHAVVLGEQRSGRSTVLLEVARRSAAERARLVVWLRASDDVACDRKGLTRHLLTATTEALSDTADAAAATWYLAWRDRVYLRDASPSTERDLLSSALILAAAPGADIDRAIVEHDLAVLLKLARDAAMSGVVICVDDASSLTEDVALVEELVNTVDAIGGYGILMAGLPATAKHFVEAASPCLARFAPVWLNPFRGPHQIITSLSGPLEGSQRDWVKSDDAAFVRDVLRLTGGNPYELMLVGHHLWLTCQRGEQEQYVLTPRVLDRLIPHLSLLASGGDALLDGAQAIDALADEQVRQAVELVALSRLSVREIAIARIMKITSRDADRVDRAILRADIGQETTRVLADLEELQDAGVIQIHADGEHFSVVGDRPATVLLKYKARARIGAEASSQPFELDFLFAVGRALVRDATLRTLESVAGSASLGFSAVMSRDGAGKLSPRPAIRHLAASGGIDRLVEAEIDLLPGGAREYKRIAELLAEDDPGIALVWTVMTYETKQLEYTELWELPPGIGHDELANAWSVVTEEWEPVVAAADLKWSGSEFAVIRGEAARQSLVVLQRYAATSAVHLLFDRWSKDRDDQALVRARQIADEAIATMRATGRSERELGGELSGMLSRLGFLNSLDDSLLDEARTALEYALRTGAADRWVTNWNLANVAFRQGDTATAMAELDRVGESLTDSHRNAVVLIFIPGRAAIDSVVRVGDAAVGELLDLQRAVAGASSDDALADVIERCRASDDMGVAQAAEWVTESLAAKG